MLAVLFCPQCLAMTQFAPGGLCGVCRVKLLNLFDPDGALTREYLLARKNCCGSGCRNCPYPKRVAS